MAMIGRAGAKLRASPAAPDRGCAREALARSNPDVQMLLTTPANTLRVRAGMRVHSKSSTGDITARFAERLRSRRKIGICHLRRPALQALRVNAALAANAALANLCSHSLTVLSPLIACGIMSPGPNRIVNPFMR